jgi:hypothetical protein
MVNYANVGTSSVALQAGTPDALPQFLNAGQNPRSGIVFRYYLAESPDTALVLNIRSSDGEIIRSYSSQADTDDGEALSARPGMNFFHWNLRSAGVPDVVESLASWTRPDGPMILPGDYVAELVVAGESFSQTFTLLPDPRVQAGPDALAQQRDLLLTICDRLTQNNQMINQLASLKEQVQSWRNRTDNPDVNSAGDAVLAKIDSMLPLLLNTGIVESQLHASGLHEKFNALFDSVDSADYAPPQQAHAVLEHLSSELDRLGVQVESELGDTVHAFNAAVQAAGFEAVSLR